LAKKYKGIILAGGEGTRLYPLTRATSKQLLPIYDLPMVLYPLNTLLEAGIEDLLIITNRKYQNNYIDLLRDGRGYGVNIDFLIQEKPEGIAQAFDLSREWLSDSPSVLILGDNLFLAGNTSQILKKAMSKNNGATIFGYKVEDPSRYGVVVLDERNNITNIEEKPVNPKSNLAVTGLYVYDNKVCDYVKLLEPSDRGELEITDLNNIYLSNKSLKLEKLDDKGFWLDAGTKESLLEASIKVKELKEKNKKLF